MPDVAKCTALKMDVVTKKSGHQMTGMAVSVCMTPAAPSPIPIPYPTMGTVAEGITDPCMRTKIGGAIVMTVGSCMSKCHGNEPGTLKEVVSLNTAGPCFPALGAPTVIMELGMAGITGSIGQMNKSITVGASGSASGAGGGAGGGGGGGGGGSGPDGQGTQGPSGGGGDGGGSSNAAAPPDPPAPPDADGQASAGHPVDVVTGAVYTNPIADFVMPGPLFSAFKRFYSSAAVERDVGLGHGWSHDFDWTATSDGTRVALVAPGGREAIVVDPADDEVVPLPHGGQLRRRGANLIVVTTDGRYLTLGPSGRRGHYLLARVADADGNALHLVWDQRDRLSGIIDSVGRIAQLVRQGRFARWEIVVVDDEGQSHLRRAATYEVDDRDDLVAVIDAGGAEVRFEYDENHYLVAERNPDGLVYRFVYADVLHQRRCVETWGELEGADVLRELGAEPVAGGRGLYHAKLHYEARRRTSVVDAIGQRHQYRGNALGLVEQYVNPAGQRFTYSYDAQGNLRHVRDAAGRSTTLMRTPAGELVGVRTPDGAQWRQRIDPVTGEVERLRPDGRRDGYRRERDKITEIRDADGFVSSRSFGERGLLESLTTRAGEHRYAYDAHGNVTSITAPDGTSTQYTFDLFGCPTRVTSAKGIEYAMEYDSRLDLVRLVEAGERVTQWEISAARKPVARQDAQGLTTFRYIGDALVEQVDPDGGHWRFGYDALCRLRWLVNPAGERYERAYDGAGYLARETSFAGLTTEYERDGSGFVVATRRSDGSWIRYERDGEGRPLQVEYSSGLVERFSYDHMGALVSAENGVTQVTFLRDELGRIVQEEMHAGEFEFAVTRTFDGIGGVARRDYASGWSVEAFRDRADGRLSTIRAQVGERFCEVGIERDALGQEVARHYESDGASAYASVGFERNRHGLPTAIVIRRGDEVLRERRYDWSPVGPVAEVSDSINGHRTYDLDSKGRVLGFRGLGGRETSTVTPHGLSVPSDGEWQLSTGGRPVVTDRARLSWDDRSRLTRREGSEARSSWSFVYDEADRLVEAKCDDGLRVRYLYDALGRQVARLREDGDSTWFGWDGDRLVEERRSTGEVIRRVHDDDGFTPLLEARGDGAFDAVVTDAAGTPWLFMKHDGAFGELELGPWGDVLRDDGCATTLRFAGQRADDDTGLHYNRHRWYDPSIRVFTTPDPLGVFVSPHEIGFVPNVTLYVDPDGLTIIVTAASDEGVQQSSGNLQRWFPGATVIPHDQLQPGSLAGEDHVILLTHGAPGKLQWGDGITNGQTVGETLKGAGLSRTAAVDLYACNGATPPRGGGPSAAQQIANATGNTVRGARSNNPEATYSGTSTPITDQRFADAGQAPPGVLAINGGTGAGVHDGEFVTVQPERGPVGRAWDTVTGRRRSGSDLPPGLPDGPAP